MPYVRIFGPWQSRPETPSREISRRTANRRSLRLPACSRVKQLASFRCARSKNGIAAPPSHGNQQMARLMSSNDDRLLTAEQVAKRLQISVRHVRRLYSCGDLKVIRVGRLVRIDLEKYLNDRRGDNQTGPER